MKVNKLAYTEVARDINARLKAYYSDHDTLGAFKPVVTVRNTRDQGDYCDKWSLAINDDLYDLLQRRGRAQDLFYSDITYTVTERDGRDFDLYIEPFNNWLFNLAVL